MGTPEKEILVYAKQKSSSKYKIPKNEKDMMAQAFSITP